MSSWSARVRNVLVWHRDQWRTEGGFNPPSEIPRALQIVPNSTRLWKLLKTVECRRPTLKDARKKGSKILKLPPVHNCFTRAMPNKLVVIINSLKVPKIKKILLYEMKFLVPNYSCLQNLWLGSYRPQIPVFSLHCPQLNLLNPLKKKFLGTPMPTSDLSANTNIQYCRTARLNLSYLKEGDLFN